MRQGFQFEAGFVVEGKLPSDPESGEIWSICADSFDDAVSQAKGFLTRLPPREDGKALLLERVGSLWERTRLPGRWKGQSVLYIPDETPSGLIPMHVIGFIRKERTAGNVDEAFYIVAPTTEDAIVAGWKVLDAKADKLFKDLKGYRLVVAKEIQKIEPPFYPGDDPHCVGLQKCIVPELAAKAS